MSQRDIERVLAGDASHDALHDREQAIVRTTWNERIAAGIAELDLESEFQAAGDRWVEADHEGHAIIPQAGGTPTGE